MMTGGKSIFPFQIYNLLEKS